MAGQLDDQSSAGTQIGLRADARRASALPPGSVRWRRVAAAAVVSAAVVVAAVAAGWDVAGWLDAVWTSLTSISLLYLVPALALQTLQTACSAAAW